MERGGRLSVLYFGEQHHAARVTTRFLTAFGMRVVPVDAKGVDPRLVPGPDVAIVEPEPGASARALCAELKRRFGVHTVVIGDRGAAPNEVPVFVRPFSHEILLDTLQSLARTREPSAQTFCEPANFRVHVCDRTIDVTNTELRLLRILLARRGQVVPRETLATALKVSPGLSSNRAIDVHVCNLRRKLGEDAKHPRLLRTVRGTGYELVVPAGAPASP